MPDPTSPTSRPFYYAVDLSAEEYTRLLAVIERTNLTGRDVFMLAVNALYEDINKLAQLTGTQPGEDTPTRQEAEADNILAEDTTTTN